MEFELYPKVKMKGLHKGWPEAYFPFKKMTTDIEKIKIK